MGRCSSCAASRRRRCARAWSACIHQAPSFCVSYGLHDGTSELRKAEGLIHAPCFLAMAAISMMPRTLMPAAAPCSVPSANPSAPTVGCTDLTLPSTGGAWHDSRGPTNSCIHYALGTNCAIVGHLYANEGLDGNAACCVCGGGQSTDAPYTPGSPSGSPVTSPPHSSPMFNYYRFTPTKVRTRGFQISELQFRYAGVVVNTSGAVAALGVQAGQT
eukprot:gene57918-biopygen13950